jgi:hypothetical protein
METITLTEAALDLLRHRFATRDNRVTAANKEAYRGAEKTCIAAR